MKTKINVLDEERQSASSMLTTVHFSMLKRFPLYAQKALTSRRKKEGKKKVRKKEERLKQRARSLLGNLSSVEVATQIFYLNQRNNSFTVVKRINADGTKELVKRLHLDPFLWLLGKGVSGRPRPKVTKSRISQV